MAISIYDVIQGPVVSNKAYKASQSNKVVLHVHKNANAVMIKEAVEKFFDVKVAKVNTLITVGKRRRVGRAFIDGAIKKRAYVTLKDGYKLSFFDHIESNVSKKD
ncbi:50S ribosomal protein L23 [bacterium]|nr:MAG: 50S ribosomal protein L23 [bacterium]QQR62043.1 MAG: 50S ribosomal protein L23 [bacterium]QQR62362.1 MAG: 50S ribosomal protein L23 [bacterium]